MREFEIGKTYEFETIEIRQDSRTGVDYIALRDDTCDTFRVYNILKYQYDDLPEKITAIVKDLDIFGRPKLRQETESIYKKIYDFGKEYSFKITDIKQDICSRTKAEYYELEDEWCVHRCYFKEQHHQIGDICAFTVEGMSDNGDYLIIEEPKLHLRTLIYDTGSPINYNDSSSSEQDCVNKCPILDLGEESTTLEYKTSIVFQNGKADVDRQLFVIVKTLVAFMNAEGGDLYIGVHDKTRQLIGIKEDLPHLNDGEDDEYNGQYDQTIDKYQLKIRHALQRLSQGVAEQQIEFDFPVQQGIQYCHIHIKKANRPIWVNDHLLFQRTGNRITLLKKDEINTFVFDRMREAISGFTNAESNSLTPEKLAEVIKIVNNAHRKSIAAPKQDLDPSEVDYYIVWFENGSWKRVRDVSIEQEAMLVLPVQKTEREGLLVFCYNSGNVNEVKLSLFKAGVNLNRLVTSKPGFNPKEKPNDIFLVNTNHFIAIYASDEHGTEYVKVHRVTDINPTQSGKNQGCRIIPQGDKILSYKLISGEHENKIKPLIYPKSKTREAGIPISSVAQHNVIEYISSL